MSISLHGRKLRLDRYGNFITDGNVIATVQSRLVTITSAQMLALSATPRTLVAAPGAGRVLIFKGAQLFYDYNSAAYAGIATGEDLAFRYTDGSGAIAATLETTGFLDATADARRWVPEGASPAATAAGVAIVANAPLVLHMTAGEITTGDSPLLVRTFYLNVSADLP